MEELEEEIVNKQKEVNYFLWQVLITVNSFLATLLIALLALKSFNQIAKLAISLGLILTSSSCVLLIINFLNVKEIYSKIAKGIKGHKVLTKEVEESDIKYAVGKYEENQRNEMIAIFSTLVAWIILLLVIFSLLV